MNGAFQTWLLDFCDALGIPLPIHPSDERRFELPVEVVEEDGSLTTNFSASWKVGHVAVEGKASTISAAEATAREGDIFLRKAFTCIAWCPRCSQYGDWAGWVLHGSDYPLPGIMPLDASAAEPMTALRRHSPLLFDVVLKRHLRAGTHRLAHQAFETRRCFMPDRAKLPHAS